MDLDASALTERIAAPSRRRNLRGKVIGLVAPIATFAFLIALWWALVAFFTIPEYLVPSPEAVVPALFANSTDLWEQSVTTLTEIVFGFLITVVFAVPMGLAIALSVTAKRIAYPILVFVQLIPKIAIAPLFVVWFGFGLQSKLLLTVLMTFFPLLLSSIAGFQTLDQRLLYLTRSMGASKLQTFWSVRLPSAMPIIFSGLKTAATIATTAAIVAEFVGSNAGLGYRMLTATLYLDTPLIFAILAILTVIGLSMNYLIEALEYLVMPWQRAHD
jgi:NitT/TauT family transport system permease protein